MATLTVTLSATDGTTRTISVPVTVDPPVRGFFPGAFPGPTTFPGKGN